LALWIVHTHAFEASSITPRLFITSPEKRCGKTTLLRVIQALVPKPLLASNITAAAIFRTVEIARPTLLIDEGDTFLRENEELRGVLNSGHSKDGQVGTSVEKEDRPECAVETVPEDPSHPDGATDTYLIFDGRRIAKRGKPGTLHAMTWISGGHRVAGS
jgi:hypothetical protein